MYREELSTNNQVFVVPLCGTKSLGSGSWFAREDTTHRDGGRYQLGNVVMVLLEVEIETDTLRAEMVFRNSCNGNFVSVSERR